MILKVIDIVGTDVYTASGGNKLYDAILPLIKSRVLILVSFEGCGMPSSSFLNTSLVRIERDLGIQRVKGLVKITNTTPTIKNYIASYLKQLRDVTTKDKLVYHLV